MNKIRVLGFSVDAYEKAELDKMSDQHKLQIAESDTENCVIYESLRNWQNDLNFDFIDTDNNWWYFVED